MNLLAKHHGRSYQGTDPNKLLQDVRDGHRAMVDRILRSPFTSTEQDKELSKEFNEHEIEWFELQPLTVIINNIVEIYRK